MVRKLRYHACLGYNHHITGSGHPETRARQLCGCQTAFLGHDVEQLEGVRKVWMKTIAFNYDKSGKADFNLEQFPDLLNSPTNNSRRR
jgi:hypothetical protein